MQDSNKIVHGLWIGESIGIIELLTIQSFTFNNHIFWLWVYDKNLKNLPNNKNLILKDANEIIPEKYVFRYKYTNQFGHGKGSYAGFSDIFRYKLLYLYGGWWTDMDVTCLKPLDFDEDYVFRSHQSLPLVGNIMKCPKNCLLMKSCFDEAIIKVTAENKNWHLPIEILINNVNQLNLNKYILNFSNPDSWNLIRKFLKSNYPIPENWYVIHWVNEEWRRNRINKNSFFQNSLFYKTAISYNLKPKKLKGFEKLKVYIKLTKINFGFEYLLSKLFKV